MKKTYSIILVALIYLTQQNATAQLWMGVYGMRTNSTNTLTSPDVGGGLTMSFLSDFKSLSPPAKKILELSPANKVKEIPVQKTGMKVQYGGNFYYSGLGQRNFNNVPLLTPQVGLAKVNLSNTLFSMNVMTRFSFVNPSIFIPYFDLFAGYRGTLSNVTVTSYNQNYQAPSNQNQNQGDKPLASVSGLNYGVGGGIMTSLGKRIKLDIGVSYAEAFQSGRIADLNTAYANQSGINLNLKTAPNSMMMINVGLLFYLYDDESSKDDDDCKCKHHHNSSSSVRWGSGGWSGSGGYSGSVGMHIGGGGGIRIK